MQTLVLVGDQIPGACRSALQAACLGARLAVTSYVITRNVKEQFAVFGAGGAIVSGLLTLWSSQCCSQRRPQGRGKAGRSRSVTKRSRGGSSW